MSLSSTQADRNLVLDVLLEHFGPIIKVVGAALLSFEWATLPELVTQVRRMQAPGPMAPGLRVDDVGPHGPPLPPITAAMVRQGLLVLLQHNCLEIRTPRLDEMRRVPAGGLFYRLRHAEVLLRIRAQRCIRCAALKPEFGKTGAVIVELLWKHGRMCIDAIKADAASWLLQSEAAARAEPGADAVTIKAQEVAEKRTHVQHVFKEMVRGRYIVKVPPLDVTTPSELPQFHTPLGRGAKSAGTGAGNAGGGRGGRGGRGGSGSRGAPALAAGGSRGRASGGRGGAAGRGSGKRKRATPAFVPPPVAGNNDLPVEMQMMMGGEADTSASPASPKANSSDEEVEFEGPAKKARNEGGDSKSGASSGGGSSCGGSGGGGGGGSSGGGSSSGTGRSRSAGVYDESPVEPAAVWRIGMDQFHRDFRHAACLSYVEDKFQNAYGVEIYRRLLEFAMPSERTARDKMSAPIPFGLVERAVMHLQQEHKIPVIRWIQVFDIDQAGVAMIQSARPPSAAEPSGSGRCIVLRFQSLINTLRMITVESMLSERHGRAYSRVWKVLASKKMMDQTRVAITALLPPKEANEIIYRLFRERFIGMDEVPKRSGSAAAAAPSVNNNSSSGSQSNVAHVWSVDQREVCRTVIRILHAALLRVRIRRRTHFEEHRDLLERGARFGWAHDDSQGRSKKRHQQMTGGGSGVGQDDAAAGGTFGAVQDAEEPDGGRNAGEGVLRGNFLAAVAALKRLELTEVQLDDQLALFDAF